MMHPTTAGQEATFEIHFASLFTAGRGFSFPCDAAGRIDLDGVGEQVRNNYLFARAMVGRDFATPVLRATARGH